MKRVYLDDGRWNNDNFQAIREISDLIEDLFTRVEGFGYNCREAGLLITEEISLRTIERQLTKKWKEETNVSDSQAT